jgi:serine/threonine-protein kinase
MAVVYRAKDLRLGRSVALKVLAPELARNDVFRKRFVHESEVAAAIDHPHIVPIFEAGETEGILYIAMRYVEGSDLRTLIDREGPLPLDTGGRIAVQIASALDAAHSHDLVHRDVKPGNILIAEGTDADHPEHVYLTDFGLTKKSLSLTGFTTVGQFVGTLDYVAPEQISGHPVDGRCDVYSLGCVVFEMLTATAPFRRDDDLALLWAHLYAEPPRLTPLRPELPAAVDEVIGRALAKSPGERYDTCLRFVAALRAAWSVRDEVPSGPSLEHPPTQVVPAVPDAAPPEAASEALRNRALPLPEPPEPPRWALPVFPRA